jgi:hypothetical protein
MQILETIPSRLDRELSQMWLNANRMKARGAGQAVTEAESALLAIGKEWKKRFDAIRRHRGVPRVQPATASSLRTMTPTALQKFIQTNFLSPDDLLAAAEEVHRRLKIPARTVEQATDQDKVRKLEERLHRRLIELTHWFRWPSTFAIPGVNHIPNPDWHEEGMLKFLGYQVGETAGLAEGVRQAVLASIFGGDLPPIISADYMQEWGSPGSAARLEKMANSLAAFIRNARRNRGANMTTAIRHWEADLEFLFESYYRDMFRFGWPN